MAVLESVPFPIFGGERISTYCRECNEPIFIDVKVEFNVSKREVPGREEERDEQLDTTEPAAVDGHGD